MQEPAGSPGAVHLRPLEPDRDGAAVVDLRCRAFGMLSQAQRESWAAENEPVMRDGRYLGAFAGPRLVGMGRFHDMQQCWHGRAVPMAGVASVGVAPEERGRGVGRRLVTAMLAAIASRGYPLSVLFPSTLPLYRSLGWEVAGTSYEAVFPAHALRSLAAPAAAGLVRRAGPGDAAEVCEVTRRVHTAARDCGPAVRDTATMRRYLSDPQLYCYLAPDGVLAHAWRHGHDEVFVHTAVAGSEQTTRALWSIVASHCWLTDTVRARVGPADPVWWLVRDPVADIVDHDDWMLRVVDPVAAIAARGFPPGADLSLPLELTDTARPASSGSWRLKISAGHGSLSRAEAPSEPHLPGQDDPGPGPAGRGADSAGPAGRGAGGPGAAGSGTGCLGADGPGGALRLGAGGLAALYAGTPVATLRRAGLAAGGDPAADDLLDGAFGASPFMLDRF